MSTSSFVRLSHDVFTNGLVAVMGPHAFTVWCVLLKHSNGIGTSCYPSHATLAKQAGVSVKTSQRSVAKLEELGLVRIDRRKDASSNTRNVYFMLDGARESPSMETERRQQTAEIATVSPSDSDRESLEVETESLSKKNHRRRTKKKSAFAPPSLEEVRREITTRKLPIDAEHFVAYYESQGWKKSNGRTVKNWQACLTTWTMRERNASSPVSLEARPSKPLVNAATMRRGARNG